MEFSFDKSLEIISNTPTVLSALLHNLSDDWVNHNEEENTWTVKEVVAHLIICEQTNWIPRIRIILNSPETVFPPIDMQAHFKLAANHSITDLLEQFGQIRAVGISELKDYNLRETDFLKTANHPVIGKVSLSQLISTWTAHDLTHLAQIARILAKQNKDLVGNFNQYLNILN